MLTNLVGGGLVAKMILVAHISHKSSCIGIVEYPGWFAKFVDV